MIDEGFDDNDAEVERIWTEFWAPLLRDATGALDMRLVKAELADYSHVLDEVPQVYIHITGNRMSKCNYFARDVIAVHEDYYAERDVECSMCGHRVSNMSELLCDDCVQERVPRVFHGTATGPHGIDYDGFAFVYARQPGEWAAWRFGLLNAWRAMDSTGQRHQGITFTLWGARRKGQRRSAA